MSVLAAFAISSGEANAGEIVTKAGGLNYVELTEPVAAQGAQNEVAARCPGAAPQRAFGGGVVSNASGEGDIQVVQSAIVQFGVNLDGWAGVVHNRSANPGDTITAYAICDDGIRIHSGNSYQFTAGATLTRGNDCPGNAHAITASYAPSGFPDPLLELSSFTTVDGPDSDKARDDGARVRLYNPTASDATVGVGVNCAKKSADVAYRSKGFKTPPDEGAQKKVGCGKGEHVLGGNVRASQPGKQQIIGMRPFDSDDGGAAPDDGWLAQTLNTREGPGASAVGYMVTAICLK